MALPTPLLAPICRRAMKLPREQVRNLRRMAEAALHEYGISGAGLRFLKHGKQPAFRVQQQARASMSHGRGGYREGAFLLRMYSPADRTPGVIRSELQWLRSILDETRIVVPEPVVNLQGDVVTKVSPDDGGTPFHCALTRWVEGTFYLRKHGPGPGPLRRVGRAMAQLHLHGHRFRRPRGFRCHRWDEEGIFGATSPYYPGAEKRILPERDQRLFSTVARRMRRVMAQLGTGPDVFGLVHADLIQINYLFHHGEVRVIDFGDFGDAHYLYDMGVTLFALWGRDDTLSQRHAFLEGYREIRPFSVDHEKLLDLFVAARGVALVRLAIGSMDDRLNHTRTRLHHQSSRRNPPLGRSVLTAVPGCAIATLGFGIKTPVGVSRMTPKAKMGFRFVFPAAASSAPGREQFRRCQKKRFVRPPT